MNKNDILAKLQDIIREVVDDEYVVITEVTTANDVDGWDSLNHVMIIAEIQNEFRVKFSSTELGSLKNVGAIVDVIVNKISL